MPTTAITFNDESLTAAALQYLDKPVNMREVTYVAWEHAMSAKETLKTGEYIIPRWTVNRHSNPSPLTNGYEMPDLTVATVYQPGVQRPIFLVQPIMISMVDDAKYGGSGALLDVLKDRTMVVEDHMKANGQAVEFRGPAASGSWAGVSAYSGWVSLNGVDSTTGFFEAAVSGTNTLHGVSKATYPAATHPRFHNFYRDCASAAGVNLLNALHGATIAIELRAGPIRGSEMKYYAGATPAEFMKRVLRPLEQYATQKELDDGERRALQFGGSALYPIADMPTTGASSASQRWSIAGVNWKRSVTPRLYNNWTGGLGVKFASIPGTANVRVGLMTFGGNQTANEMGVSLLITNAETF